jgi:hypothetical protein
MCLYLRYYLVNLTFEWKYCYKRCSIVIFFSNSLLYETLRVIYIWGLNMYVDFVVVFIQYSYVRSYLYRVYVYTRVFMFILNLYE